MIHQERSPLFFPLIINLFKFLKKLSTIKEQLFSNTFINNWYNEYPETIYYILPIYSNDNQFLM